MNKKVIKIIVVVVILIGAYLIFSGGFGKETLNVEADLAAIELTDEERQALAEEGIELPSDSDSVIDQLQQVNSSDEISDIEADLSATNLDDLDAALDAIDNDLLGL
jgi:hypothetical protein